MHQNIARTMQYVELDLETLLVRKHHVLCTRCGKHEPVHPGDGMPAVTFIMALKLMAARHLGCRPRPRSA